MRAFAKPSRPKPRAFRVWLLLVLVALTSSSTLAWAAPCGAHEDLAAAEGPADCCDENAGDADVQEDEGACSCPVDCGPCCAGAPPSAVIDVPGVVAVLLPAYELLSFATTSHARPEGTRLDILHVPRS